MNKPAVEFVTFIVCIVATSTAKKSNAFNL